MRDQIPIPIPIPTPSRNAEDILANDPPPPYTGSTGFSVADGPFFYKDMKIAQLRSFLRERGVADGDILDKETLCLRAWETHCECLTVAELTKFLADQQISTSDCRDIGSRRQKAKDAFQPPNRPPPPPASSDTTSIRFSKDDVVVLKGLSRGEMNGKRGTIVSTDLPAGRAFIKLESSGGDKTFKIKFENLELANDDFVEELE